MTLRTAFALLLLVACAGCISHPRFTVYVERAVAETDGERRQRATTIKEGASVTVDLTLP